MLLDAFHKWSSWYRTGPIVTLVQQRVLQKHKWRIISHCLMYHSHWFCSVMEHWQRDLFKETSMQWTAALPVELQIYKNGLFSVWIDCYLNWKLCSWTDFLCAFHPSLILVDVKRETKRTEYPTVPLAQQLLPASLNRPLGLPGVPIQSVVLGNHSTGGGKEVFLLGWPRLPQPVFCNAKEQCHPGILQANLISSACICSLIPPSHYIKLVPEVKT